MIYFLAATVPLSGACKGCAGAHVGANTISSGGSEIRRAPLSKHSGTDQPWAGPGSTMPGHSLSSKGNDKALWTPGAEVGSREAGSGPQPGCSASLKLPWDPVVSPLRRGHYPTQLPGAQVTWSSGPGQLGRDSIFDPLEQTEARASLKSAAESCPLPTGIHSANPAGRSRVTFPQDPRPGSPWDRAECR